MRTGWAEPNAEMLVLARQAKGFTQEELAQRLKVSAGLISKWEHGIAVPGPSHIDALVDVLGFPPSLFYRSERVRGTDSICFHHRKRKSMPAKLLDRVEANMHLAQLQMKRLLAELSIESAFSLMVLDPEEHGGPEGVARSLRTFWRLPRGPISNMVRVIEAAGGVVLLRRFGTPKLDGMSCWAKNTPPLFFVNADNPVERQRWTIAHELGHLTMHSVPPEEDPEVQAESFAREFLMPATETNPDLRRLTFQTLPALKQSWRVPMKEIITAAARRDALPTNKVKSLSVQYSRAGWNTREPFALSPERPSLAETAIRVHLTDHGYSTEELATISDLFPEDFVREYPLEGERLRAI